MKMIKLHNIVCFFSLIHLFTPHRIHLLSLHFPAPKHASASPPTPLPLSQVGAFDRPECSNLRSFADDHRVVIAGGFFGGKTETVQHVARLYADTLQQQVTCDCLVTCDDCVTLQQLGEGPPGGMIDDDQLIWLGILCARPATSGP